jgi:DNA-binding transcriptional MerR regulator
MATREALWDLEDLCARVALALAVDYTGQASGRVRDVPDPRTIRYYSTLGLLDRPAAMRGRTALYGVRHLRQLVAIKRLQTHGLSLAEIQQRLVGLNDQALQEIARVPAGLEEQEPAPSGTEDSENMGREESSRRQSAFWTSVPAAPAPCPETVQVTLAPGVNLQLDVLRPPDAHDLTALAAAAGPLLKLLRARRLVPPEGKAPPTSEETSC